jgi:uncharacterized protein YjbI with pentapeptide repeats
LPLTTRARTVLWIATILILLLIGARSARWTGFSGRTPWEYLDVFLVPVAVGVATLWFTATQDEIARNTEEQRAQDDALQAYLDKMSELLIDGHLHEKADQYDTTRITARARTLAVLRRLAGKRKRTVLLFLREARLINRYDFLDPEERDDVRYYAHYVGLEDADLSKAELDSARLISTSGTEPISLKGANLKGAKLRGANLRGADLRKADLSEADLSGTNLSEADLRQTRLFGADLSGADLPPTDLALVDLSGANLSRANLSDANLSDADLGAANLRGAYKLNSDGSRQIVTNEELRAQAASLEGATMPNGQKYEDWLKDIEHREDAR